MKRMEEVISETILNQGSYQNPNEFIAQKMDENLKNDFSSEDLSMMAKRLVRNSSI